MSNEEVYRRCGMDVKAKGVKCRRVQWVRHNLLGWFGHVITMQNGEFVKRVCESQTGGQADNIKEYIKERGVAHSWIWKKLMIGWTEESVYKFVIKRNKGLLKRS